MFERILLAVDDSPLSAKAEAAAIELAAGLGARLVVLHVVPDYPTSGFDGRLPQAPEDLSRKERDWHDRARALVDAVVAAAAERGVQAEGLLAHSDRVAESLVAGALKHGCHMIVMASHGRHGLQRVLLGSQTQAVLAHSPVPVLVLR